MIELTQVESSMIEAWGYDQSTNALYVRFKGGKLYRYADVPAAEIESLQQAESIGRFINATIKPNYACERVDE